MSAGRWAGHGRGAQPCPASLSPLPCPAFWLSGASGLAGKGSAGGRARLWGCRVRICVRSVRRGRGGTAQLSPLGTDVGGSGAALSSSPLPGKLPGLKVCRVSRAGGASEPRSTPGVFSKLGAAPATGDPAGKGGESRGSGWALLSCRCWGSCKLVDLK